MNLPFFFVPKAPEANEELLLDEDNAKHAVQSLRMTEGQRLYLTDGRGGLAKAEITEARKKYCSVRALDVQFIPRQGSHASIAISLVKNSSRFEWFLEKAAELGIASIIPLLCERTEKQYFRRERFVNICISAMLQSRQVWLPELHPASSFLTAVSEASQDQRFIAHCMDGQKRNLADLFDHTLSSHLILVGPEGDFTPSEVQLAAARGFDGVSLGSSRLRTETAGMVAAAVFRVF